MPIGKNKKALTAYVLNSTKEKIKELAKTGKSESAVAGQILDKALEFDPEYGDLSCLSNQYAKIHKK